MKTEPASIQRSGIVFLGGLSAAGRLEWRQRHCSGFLVYPGFHYPGLPNTRLWQTNRNLLAVIPAQAGIQWFIMIHSRPSGNDNSIK